VKGFDSGQSERWMPCFIIIYLFTGENPAVVASAWKTWPRGQWSNEWYLGPGMCLSLFIRGSRL